MIIKLSQIENILNQASKNILLYIGMNIGEAALMSADRSLLMSMGVDIDGLGGAFPPYYKMFLLGRLTQMIGDQNSQKLELSDFEKYLQSGQYQPLTPFEEAQYMIARQMSYAHLKNLENRVRDDVNGAILEELTRSEYENIIKEEVEAGVRERKSITNIISDIGHRTGDWSKDLGRIVDTEMNNIFQKGRVVELKKTDPTKDPLVYKDVYEGACRHCIALYLTDGLGSQPRLFKLSELVANGSNIGRKVADWKATITGVHPWCRCTLRKLIKGMTWSATDKQFVHDAKVLKQEEKRLGIKGVVKVTIGNKVIIV
jgi:hypothetical protein